MIQNYAYNDEKCCHKINIEFIRKNKIYNKEAYLIIKKEMDKNLKDKNIIFKKDISILPKINNNRVFSLRNFGNKKNIS